MCQYYSTTAYSLFWLLYVMQELHPRDFYQKHIKPRRPLVYRKMVVDTPARRLWSDEYLRNTYGSLDVLCEVKHEDRSKSPRRMRMTDFLDRYQKDNVYIVTVLPDVMRKQIKVLLPAQTLHLYSVTYMQHSNFQNQETSYQCTKDEVRESFFPIFMTPYSKTNLL